MDYDVIIIGAGPAGATAAIYADRAGLKTLLLEKLFIGGQIVNTYEVENYTGIKYILGTDLVTKIEEHIKNFEIDFKREEVKEILFEGNAKIVKTKKNEYRSKTIILTMGSNPRYLNITGEEQFKARGVSYCATCDGALYRKQNVVVIGGGNTAVEDAIFLSRMCDTVHIVHRRDQFRADKKVVNNLLNIKNIIVHFDCVAEEIGGSKTAEYINIKNVKTNEITKIDTSCVFVAIGQIPNNDLVKDKIKTDEAGYIITDNNMATNVAGVYAAGDGRVNILKQIITSAGEGAIAAYGASVFIASS